LSQEDELVDGLAISEFKGVVVRGVLLVRLDGGHDADGRIIRKVDVPEGHGLDGGHRPQQQLQRTARHLHGGGLEADCAPLPVRGTLFNFALLYNFYDVMFLLYHRGAHLYYGRARGEVGELYLQNERVVQRRFVSLAPLVRNTWARVHTRCEAAAAARTLCERERNSFAARVANFSLISSSTQLVLSHAQ